jgi:hypothetical protein
VARPIRRSGVMAAFDHSAIGHGVAAAFRHQSFDKPGAV